MIADDTRSEFDQCSLDFPAPELSAGKADQQRADGSCTGCLIDCEKAEIHAAEHKNKQCDHGPQTLERVEALTPAVDGAARHDMGLPPAQIAHNTEIEKNAEKARDDPGEEKLLHIGLGHEAVEHEYDRGRNHDAQRAPGRDDTSGKASVIARTPHFRQRNLAHSCGCGDGRAVDGGEPAAGKDSSEGQSARAVPDPRVAGIEELAAHAGLRGEGAHENEHRDDAQVVVRQHGERYICQQIQTRTPAGDDRKPQHADYAHGHADRHPQRHEHEHGDEAEQGHEVTVHVRSPPLRPGFVDRSKAPRSAWPPGSPPPSHRQRQQHRNR